MRQSQHIVRRPKVIVVVVVVILVIVVVIIVIVAKGIVSKVVYIVDGF